MLAQDYETYVDKMLAKHCANKKQPYAQPTANDHPTLKPRWPSTFANQFANVGLTFLCYQGYCFKYILFWQKRPVQIYIEVQYLLHVNIYMYRDEILKMVQTCFGYKYLSDRRPSFEISCLRHFRLPIIFFQLFPSMDSDN